MVALKRYVCFVGTSHDVLFCSTRRGSFPPIFERTSICSLWREASVHMDSDTHQHFILSNVTLNEEDLVPRGKRDVLTFLRETCKVLFIALLLNVFIYLLLIHLIRESFLYPYINHRVESQNDIKLVDELFFAMFVLYCSICFHFPCLVICGYVLVIISATGWIDGVICQHITKYEKWNM